jgi:hypothetical protein
VESRKQKIWATDGAHHSFVSIDSVDNPLARLFRSTVQSVIFFIILLDLGGLLGGVDFLLQLSRPAIFTFTF